MTETEDDVLQSGVLGWCWAGQGWAARRPSEAGCGERWLDGGRLAAPGWPVVREVYSPAGLGWSGLVFTVQRTVEN